jgi:hypothetical protein
MAATARAQTSGQSAAPSPIHQGKTMNMLRFAIRDDVEDGRSLLARRFLFDPKSIFGVQLEVVERTSVDRGKESDRALPSGGLRRERAQGITTVVAYRCFAMPRFKLLIKHTTRAVKAPMKEPPHTQAAKCRVEAPCSPIPAPRDDR